MSLKAPGLGPENRGVARRVPAIQAILNQEAAGAGIKNAVFADLEGFVIAAWDDGQRARDIEALTAVATASFIAVGEMAKMVGESRFSTVFHQGEKESLCFSRIHEQLLIFVFDSTVPLGGVRMRMHRALERIESLIRQQLEA